MYTSIYRGTVYTGVYRYIQMYTSIYGGIYRCIQVYIEVYTGNTDIHWYIQELMGVYIIGCLAL